MPRTTKPTSRSAKKILVVEDEGQIGLMLNLILAERDLQMDYVNTLLAADEYLLKEKPDLILLDNKLPDGFGVDFISYIQKKYTGIKIIMISGFGSVRDVALNNGATAFLEKPFSVEQLNKAIDEALG